MAIINFKNGTQQTIEPDKASVVWQWFNGDVAATPEQQAYVEQVKEIRLNWRKAPDSYLLKHARHLKPIILNYWVCDRDGTPTRPEPNDEPTWHASRVLGLL